MSQSSSISTVDRFSARTYTHTQHARFHVHTHTHTHTAGTQAHRNHVRVWVPGEFVVGEAIEKNSMYELVVCRPDGLETVA